MSEKYDYLVVGAGLAGCVMAERLASQSDKKVLIIDKRPHIGGNCYDRIDDAGVLIHQYGPHYFRTDSQEVFDYLSNFTEWYYHDYKVKVKIRDKLYTFPINLNTLREFYGREFTEEEAKAFLEEIRDKSIIHPRNAEEQVVSQIGWELYEAFFKGYTEKQWGMKATELDASVTARIPIRTNTDDRYVLGRIQAMPKDGYTKMFERMIARSNISVSLNTPFNESSKALADKIIWTGRIDEFFEYKFGKLVYRSLDFNFKSFFDIEYKQECEQINYCDKTILFTRTVEVKHATGQKGPNTTISTEYPQPNGEPFYPVICKENLDIYTRYLIESSYEPCVYFIGRLAQYKYLNMDEVIKSALSLYLKIKDR